VRKIKSNFFISIDGVVESPDKWHFPYFDDEMGAAVGAGFATADALLMGRALYDEWAAYWPEHADEPFGDVMNSIKKYVVSNSLRSAEWQNSEIISGDRVQRLTDVKAQDGGDIAMSGTRPPSAGCCVRASSTSSTCSCTRSWSATAWHGSFLRTNRASPSSS
jgi:dihydrofolate reductase